MTLTQLKYLLAVYDFGSFSSAAQNCFITQPTLSMQIQKLEEELGVIIFDRTKKPLKATAIGEEIIQQARQNVQGIERIKEREQTEEINGQLRIGIIPTVAPYLLPLFVTSFLEKYPNVSLVIEEFISDQIVRGLKQYKLDAGILVTPLNDNSINEIPLYYEKFVAYISTNHPLIHHDTIDLDKLNIDEILLLNEGHCFREQVVNICPDSQQQNWKGQLRFESGSLETLKKIVENNFGYTLLPELAVLNADEKHKKFIKALNDPKPVREVSLITHHTVLKRNLIKVFRECVVENLPQKVIKNKKDNLINWT